MPDTTAQWVWFGFYTLGSFGGWLILALMLRDKLRLAIHRNDKA